MNARIEWMEQGHAAPAPTEALRLAAQQVLGSALFARAPRSCKLLRFLVDATLEGRQGRISEHTIGLAVFRRDARSYDTTLDPVVRVQMGRLRARLATYAAAHRETGPQLCIPAGSYVPGFSQAVNSDNDAEAQAAPSVRRPMQLAPLRNLTGAQDKQAFIAGIDEELGSKLFQVFGSLVQLPQQSLAWPEHPGRGAGFPQQRLEGSIRVEKNHVRASMRLVDTRTGDIAWLAQIDHRGELGMLLQEQLASMICGQLQSYLAPA